MNDYEKDDREFSLLQLEWIRFAIQEAQNGNLEELDQALELVEELREKHKTYIDFGVEIKGVEHGSKTKRKEVL